MKDPTIPDVENRKKIMFYESPENQIKLKIRCDYDGITQSQFFRMMISGYISNDKNIYEFIKYCLYTASVNDELENIFDVIEMETGI